MTDEEAKSCRYFVSYTGVKLPVKLVNELELADLNNRNTFIQAFYDDQDRLAGFEKMVYGAVEISHRYDYYPDGVLKRAEISMDEDVTELHYDVTGAAVSA
jgi:hypothetical protein